MAYIQKREEFKEERKKRKKPEGLKFTVHLELTNVELIRSEVELFPFICQLCMSLIQYAVIRQYKGLRNESHILGDGIFLLFLSL